MKVSLYDIIWMLVALQVIKLSIVVIKLILTEILENQLLRKPKPYDPIRQIITYMRFSLLFDILQLLFILIVLIYYRQ